MCRAAKILKFGITKNKELDRGLRGYARMGEFVLSVFIRAYPRNPRCFRRCRPVIVLSLHFRRGMGAWPLLTSAAGDTRSPFGSRLNFLRKGTNVLRARLPSTL